MAKRRRESDSDVTTPEAEDYNTVFVDTSFDTHLAILVSKSDTVSDFKEKIVLEHVRSFPEHGEIKIHSLKVKRRGSFYHLSDIMPVCSVFQRVKGNWFVSADSSSISNTYLNPKSPEHGASDSLRVDLERSSDDYCRVLSSDVIKVHPPIMSVPHGDLENDVISEMMNGSKVNKSTKKTSDFQWNDYSVENSIETESHAKKKLKITPDEYIHQSPSLEDNHAIFHEAGKDTSQAMIVGCGNSMVDAVIEASEGILVRNQLEKPTMSETNAEVSSVPDLAREIDIESNVNSQSLLASNSKKEILYMSVVSQSITADKSEYELGQNVRIDNLESVIVSELNHSIKSVDDSDKTQNVKSSGNKKRKKVKKRGARIQDSPYLEHETEKGESVEGECIAGAAETSNIGSIANSQEVLDTDRRKEGFVLQNEISENFVAEKSEKEHGQNDRVDCAEVVTVNKVNLSAIDSSGAKPANSDGNKRRKKAKKPAAAKESVVDSQYQLALDKTKEDTVFEDGVPEFMTGESGNELGLNIPAEHLEDITMKESNLFAELVDMTGTMEGAKSNGKKKKKKRKAKKEDAKVPDTSELQHETGEGESIEPNTETCEAGKAQEETQSSLNRDEVMMSSYNKTSDVSPNLLEANICAEPKISSGSRKKNKKGKKSADTNLEKSGLEHINNGVSGSAVFPCSTADHILEETGKDLPLNFIDAPAGDASEKFQSFTGNEADFVASQTEQTLGNVGSEEEMGKNNQGSCNFVSDSTTVVKENLELNQRDENSKSTENKGKKAKKKRKKNLPIASDGQANLPVEDQKVDVEVLATDENLTSIRNPELQQRESSSPIIPDKLEENTGEMHQEPHSADEGINFAQYFVPGRSISESVIASGSAMKGSSAKEMQEMMTIQKHNEALPASSYTRGTITCLARSSSERSETFPENTRSKRREPDSDGKSTVVMRPPQNRTKSGSSLLTKSRAISQVNSPNKTNMKTPQKKSLLAKPGSIFQDHSGEASEDENGSIDSDASTGSSDSSTASGDSDKESEFSQYSTRNGFNDGKGRSTGGKSKSKLDLSAMNGMTMDKLLRSSSQYKKAKLQASQSEFDQDESQQIDFVPDSLANP